ncbi:MAG: lactoylglutathione lyase-like lyase [Verrucomicrobia bacterium]|nr:lactoylglutathione lyase-like lyase [Verrucomicrobiota bacterium]
MNPILGNGGFHHVCMKTRDWDATMRFYQDVLGCTEKVAWRDAPQRAVMLDAGDGNYIEVFEDLAYTGATNGAIYHYAFRTTRLDDVAARVRAAGFKITVEPRDVTIPNTTSVGPVPVRIFFCEGPNGESIEFLQNSLT